MSTFTELLDEYLEAKAEVAQLREHYAGYDFDYHHFKESERLREARNALNVAYLQAADKTPITFGSFA
ncbi:hypothetical protein [Polynucleobacter sp. UK-Kesae-W10]|uniref:hypothetical protein n=1 Tax=Polynucleobacter sp. UK-Kesae-W10 TaxID=1819738 RepID=UPI001C0E6C1E|nr:hypothetical protein [Polynucleobacter sp. UK-Kesae-W10]MBU3577551.1 hypothetical protein [Polynucleobacter sp. UK-Kesae-W10]